MTDTITAEQGAGDGGFILPSMTLNLPSGQVALFDEQDAVLVGLYSWCAAQSKTGPLYVVSKIKSRGRIKIVRLHRLIMRAKEGQIVDHINGDTLDNRRSNLRFANQQQNSQNRKSRANSSSCFKGVWFDKPKRKWRADIRVDGNKICLGAFANEVCAARAYDAAAVIWHGDFARLNFPKEHGRSETTSAAQPFL